MDKFIGVASRWYQKAVDCDDRFDQFISVWISFNAIYGYRNGKELEKINSILKEFNIEAIENILSRSEVQYFMDMVPSIQYLNLDKVILNTSNSQEKLKRNISSNPRLALENLMFILNKVRNNLFHGDKRIESNRDVDIVKHAYPIIREIVRIHLGFDENITSTNQESPPISNSIEQKIHEKSVAHLEEWTKMLEEYTIISKDTNHPISLLLDRVNIQGNALEHGGITPSQMKGIQENLLELYDKRKPEVIRDIEEVYTFVSKRMSEVIDNGCEEIEVKNFHKEYIKLQKKYEDKGYKFKM